MPDPYSSYLSGRNNSPALRDYQHARRLYLDNIYALAPKAGWIYFITFDVNPKVRANFINEDLTVLTDSGLLGKKVDLPKFKIKTEVVNQYNRKTQVQTALNYDPVSIDLHDDRIGTTTRLWRNYYSYHFADSNYKSLGVTNNAAFQDNRYDVRQYNYGMDNAATVNKDGSFNGRFFNKINIFVLTNIDKHRFIKYSLINPLVTDWNHDTLDQDTNKFLASKITFVYESVAYEEGIVENSEEASGFKTTYYDSFPSPLVNAFNAAAGSISNNPSGIAKKLPPNQQPPQNITDALTIKKSEQGKGINGLINPSSSTTTGEATPVQNITISQ